MSSFWVVRGLGEGVGGLMGWAIILTRVDAVNFYSRRRLFPSTGAKVHAVLQRESATLLPLLKKPRFQAANFAEEEQTQMGVLVV